MFPPQLRALVRNVAAALFISLRAAFGSVVVVASPKENPTRPFRYQNGYQGFAVWRESGSDCRLPKEKCRLQRAGRRVKRPHMDDASFCRYFFFTRFANTLFLASFFCRRGNFVAGLLGVLLSFIGLSPDEKLQHSHFINLGRPRGWENIKTQRLPAAVLLAADVMHLGQLERMWPFLEESGSFRPLQERRKRVFPSPIAATAPIDQDWTLRNTP